MVAFQCVLQKSDQCKASMDGSLSTQVVSTVEQSLDFKLASYVEGVFGR